MCRLYGHYSTHQERVSCELLDAQNSLIKQSEEDQRGLSNPHGWGLAYQTDDSFSCTRQVEPASEDQDFRDHAMDIVSKMMMAHVRRATVGEPKYENTHPFVFEDSVLAHNGHLERFEEGMKQRILDRLTPEQKQAILGDTDSEHILHLLLSNRSPDRSLPEVIQETFSELRSWTEELARGGELAVNVLWFLGSTFAGTRFNRTLYYIERHDPHVCELCGTTHIVGDTDPTDYYSVEVASEPITSEAWTEIENHTGFVVGEDQQLELFSL